MLSLLPCLLSQIAEKKYKKDLERQKEQEELMREEMRWKSDQDKLKQQQDQEKSREGGGDNRWVSAVWYLVYAAHCQEYLELL